MVSEEKIYQVLRDAILYTDFTPGQQLKENSLAEAFQVSRTPIRSVLQRLKFESLIKLIPKKGAFVFCPNQAEAEQIFAMRKLLEPKAAELAATQATVKQIEWMYQMFEEEKHLLEEHLFLKSLIATKNFHMSIVESTGNIYLIEFLKKIITLSHIVLTFYYVFDHKEDHALGEHFLLLEAIKSRNAHEAKQIAYAHVNLMQADINFSKQYAHSLPIQQIISKYL